MPWACGAGLKSTNFVLGNTWWLQCIGEINLSLIKLYNYVFLVSVRVEEYVAGGRDKFIALVDPDLNQIYTKRKARECSISPPGP